MDSLDFFLHPTRAHVKRCKRTGKTTETVFEDLLSTPHAHYRLFVYSTRTIKINIFRERVGAQVFPHSDFPEGRGGLCHNLPPQLSLLFDARELRVMPAVPYIIRM